MQTLLLVVELFVAAALIFVILLQRSEGGALGIGGGSGGGLFSPRGAADTLTRTTVVLGTLFFLTCIGLNLLAMEGSGSRSILQTEAPAPASAPAAPAAPTKPEVPIGQ